MVFLFPLTEDGLRNNSFKDFYPPLAKTFHWSMAVLMVAMLTVGFWMVGLPQGTYRFDIIYPFHKSTGLLVLILAMLRLSYRFAHGYPSINAQLPFFHLLVARTNVVFLYALMFIMPISGVWMSFYTGRPVTFYNLITIQPVVSKNMAIAHIFKEIHEISAYVLVLLISFHVLGGFYHLFFLKDGSFQKMWWSKR